MMCKITEKEIINIGPMECTASCILTLLNSLELDGNSFFLNYWYLNYSNKILMGSKSIRHYNLDYLYNIKLELRSGNQEDLINSTGDGQIALLMCKASTLSYYPQAYTAAENFNLDHIIMVTGYDKTTDMFQVADPTVSYIGSLSAAEIVNIKRDYGKLYYLVLHYRDCSTAKNKHGETMAFITRQNYLIFALSEYNSGKAALELFYKDIVKSRKMNKKMRQLWIGQNNISITTIVKIRNEYSKQLLKSGFFSGSGELEIMENSIKKIINGWTVLNLLLLKFLRNPENNETLKKIKEKTLVLGELEQGFLEYLFKLCKME